MKRIAFFFALATSLVTCWLIPTASAGSPPPTSAWHRLNPDQSNPAPEHERLQCIEAAVWVCQYDKVPEPELNFSWDGTTGHFVGRDITDTWTCPTWLTDCATVTRVVEGVALYVPAGGQPFRVLTELVFDAAGTLYVYWVDFGFACPWFSTFAAALSANPFPLPFNGVDWPSADCVTAP
jgi:hypothetical protein